MASSKVTPHTSTTTEVDWRDAREKLLYSSLAYSSPPGSARSTCAPEIDALAHVADFFSKHPDIPARVPHAARFFNAARTGKRHTDAQFYTLEYDDRIIFAFRGTEFDQFSDIKADLDFARVWYADVAYGRCSATGSCGLDFLDKSAASQMYVHQGFHRYYESLRYSMTAVMFLHNRDFSKRFVFVGHSLGGAIATLAAAAAIATFGITTVPIECHPFGSPRCGSPAFAAFVDKYIGQTRAHDGQAPGFSRRYYNERDPVPQVLSKPASLGTAAYAHVGGGIMMPAVVKGWPWAWWPDPHHHPTGFTNDTEQVGYLASISREVAAVRDTTVSARTPGTGEAATLPGRSDG